MYSEASCYQRNTKKGKIHRSANKTTKKTNNKPNGQNKTITYSPHKSHFACLKITRRQASTDHVWNVNCRQSTRDNTEQTTTLVRKLNVFRFGNNLHFPRPVSEWSTRGLWAVCSRWKTVDVSISTDTGLRHGTHWPFQHHNTAYLPTRRESLSSRSLTSPCQSRGQHGIRREHATAAPNTPL